MLGGFFLVGWCALGVLLQASSEAAGTIIKGITKPASGPPPTDWLAPAVGASQPTAGGGSNGIW